MKIPKIKKIHRPGWEIGSHPSLGRHRSALGGSSQVSSVSARVVFGNGDLRRAGVGRGARPPDHRGSHRATGTSSLSQAKSWWNLSRPEKSAMDDSGVVRPDVYLAHWVNCRRAGRSCNSVDGICGTGRGCTSSSEWRLCTSSQSIRPDVESLCRCSPPVQGGDSARGT